MAFYKLNTPSERECESAQVLAFRLLVVHTLKGANDPTVGTNDRFGDIWSEWIEHNNAQTVDAWLLLLLLIDWVSLTGIIVDFFLGYIDYT